MRKVLGVVVIGKDGKPVTDDYDNVLLFTNADDAVPYAPKDSRVYRVMKARVGRKPKPKSE